MKLSLRWLKEFVAVKGTAAAAADVFTSGGFEVEQSVTWGQGFAGIVVGRIKTIVDHAEAERLCVCKVDVGQRELLNIVCGAKNIKPGHTVPVALVGAVLPNGLTIERRRIRGIDSEGMLCAEDELELGTDHSGIMILESALKPGAKFGPATYLEDTVFDIAVPPNRPDCYSVLGLAREYATLADVPLKKRSHTFKDTGKKTAQSLLKVTIKDADLCPHYVARVVRGVRVGRSPQLIRSRLLLSGIKPVNNVVDIANYVMLETGQPLHTFDYAAIRAKSIIVRRAGKDKEYETLNGSMQKLSSEMLVIADARGPVAVAGVMGGKNSEISRATRDVVIESAQFKPSSIRKTRQQLGLVTEASLRFERGVHWDLQEQAAERAADLLVTYAGSESARGSLASGQQKKAARKAIAITPEKISSAIGRTFTSKEITSIFDRLHFTVAAGKAKTMAVTAPAYRQDISIPADFIEEVGRVFGWQNVRSAPVIAALRPSGLSAAQRLERTLADTLVAAGLTEVKTYAYYGRQLLEQFDLQAEQHYRITNPLSPEQEYLRLSLVPQLFQVVLNNYQERKEISIFEIGREYRQKRPMPDEVETLTAILYRRQGYADAHAKGVLEAVGEKLGLPLEITPAEKNGSEAEISVQGKAVGKFGEIRNNLEKIGQPASYITLYLRALAPHLRPDRKYLPVPLFPAVERDITFTAPTNASYYAIRKALYGFNPLIADVAGTSYYAPSEKSADVTLRFRFQSAERTLESDEVTRLEHEIAGLLGERFGMAVKRKQPTK